MTPEVSCPPSKDFLYILLFLSISNLFLLSHYSLSTSSFPSLSLFSISLCSSSSTFPSNSAYQPLLPLHLLFLFHLLSSIYLNLSLTILFPSTLLSLPPSLTALHISSSRWTVHTRPALMLLYAKAATRGAASHSGSNTSNHDKCKSPCHCL